MFTRNDYLRVLWRILNLTVLLIPAPTVQTKFDAASLHEKQSLAAHYQMVDDGSGRRDIWRVVNFDLVPLDPKEYGTFYAGDCKE